MNSTIPAGFAVLRDSLTTRLHWSKRPAEPRNVRFSGPFTVPYLHIEAKSYEIQPPQMLVLRDGWSS